ncbi:MAG: hypothetical protein QM652_06825 [Legionella sp.]|uniref:hypothetical protein n=1 Tax=Legionella sp. TaxID=459 RepID=UPI0039E6F874
MSATNVVTAVTSDVVVLDYGCQYQGGFLYSVDDTTANTGSIGGKVVSLIDQAEPFTTSPRQRVLFGAPMGMTLQVVMWITQPLLESMNCRPHRPHPQLPHWVSV